MAGGTRISKIMAEFGVGFDTITNFLKRKGFNEDFNPNTKVSDEMYALLEKEYNTSRNDKKEVEKKSIDFKNKHKKETISIQQPEEIELVSSAEPVKGPKVLGKIDLDNGKKPQQQKQPQKNDQNKNQNSKPQNNGQRNDQKSQNQNQNQQNKNRQQGNEQQKPQQKPQQQQQKPQNQNDNKPARPQNGDDEVFKISNTKKLSGPTVVGKIELPIDEGREEIRGKKKKKRQRIFKDNEKVDISAQSTINQVNNSLKKDKNRRDERKNGQFGGQGGGNKNNQGGGNPNKKEKNKKRPQRQEISEEDVQKQVKDTLARLTAKGAKSKTSKHRREKREELRQSRAEEAERLDEEKKILKVTEFVTANELAIMMDVPINQVIATFMSLGMFVSINQRLDAESMAIVAEEFGFKVEFISAETATTVEEEEDDEDELQERPPIVTVMGHVDHGKTSLLDYIRNTNVISGEAGGITQHIGAYGVKLDNGRQITFLDTPGHEAFTAMRARGAQVTDVAIIIVAADDSVMPQTIEAINHASAANVPIIFAINKIDKPGANPDKIREALANMNYLVEEWGGKYQCQEISAKKGINVDKLLDKVLLEADMLELKANPNRLATGNVIESSLDKGRGYVTTLLVSNGTLHVGDMVVCGTNYGHVKAMFNERNQKVDQAGPSEPVLVLGLNGAPQAGEKFNVFTDEKEAKDLATRRDQLRREQNMHASPHLTLNEIGRRIAIGNFQEINLIVKGDVDGSVEALSDSLIKLSTEEIQINVIHKAVGQISESDIMLATASNAIVVGFQVRPSQAARKLAEREQIDIRLYSIIYDAIEELKSAMEGMLSPEIKEQVIGTLEIQETFKISKVGTIAGCIVKEGKVKSKSKVRVIRDGIVIHSGELGSLKRFKDDVKEVAAGLDCGLNIENYNDIKVGDIIEGYTEKEVARKL